MKRFAVGFLAMAVGGLASAQSSVNLFGVVDATLQLGRGSIANKTALANSGLGASQIGVRGIEDMGDGLKAGFWLEAQFMPDTGTGGTSNTNNQNSGVAPNTFAFNRRSTVSIGGNWGELRLGRDFTPHYITLAAYDPWGNLGVGAGQTLLSNPILAQGGASGPSVRASNSVSYLYNYDFQSVVIQGRQGFNAAAQYYLGENASGAANSDDGTGWGVRLGYVAGPFTVALATGKTQYATGDAKQSNLGVSYDFTVAKLIAHYQRSSLGTIGGDGVLVGGTVPAGPGYVRLAYSQFETDTAGNPSTKKFALGYVYLFSKRTAVYASAARVKNAGGASQALGGSTTAANRSSTGFDFGMRHAF